MTLQARSIDVASGWELNDFAEAFAFVKSVSDGLHENDFIMAAKLDQLGSSRE